MTRRVQVASRISVRATARATRRALFVAAVALLGAAGCKDDAPKPEPPVAPSVPPDAQDDAGREALLRIVEAETKVAFQGIRTLTQGPRGASRETRLRLVADGAGHTLLEWPGGDEAKPRRWTVEHRFEWVRRPELLLRNYKVRVDPAASPPVAWRETRRVEITGRRAGRPSLDLLVDAETWIVLAESLRDAEGSEWRSARFESIEYGKAAEEAPGERAEALPVAATREPRPADWSPLTVATSAEGFELVACGTASCGTPSKDGDQAAPTWREDWSDGLAGFSVLQRPAAASETTPAGEVRRRRWLGGASLATRRDGVEVTVYGTLLADDLLAVLRGLRPASAER